jgi:hypothetical protein
MWYHIKLGRAYSFALDMPEPFFIILCGLGEDLVEWCKHSAGQLMWPFWPE